MHKILVACTLLAIAATARPTGDTTFDFEDWAGPAIPVRLYVPAGTGATTPVVIVMHGASRDAPRYYANWRAAAEQGGFVVAVPYFSQAAFPGSARYNLGHVFDPDTGALRPAETWTFAVIEPLFDRVVAMLGGRQTGYTLYGHSAGSQFVHRFLYYVPGARVQRAIVANAGWYTVPDPGVRYPYGLAGSGVPESVLPGYLARDVVVLLGDADTERDDDTLRKTPEAELQGPHRYARDHSFYRVAAARAAALGVEFGWRLHEVQGAAHSNAEMTPAAASFVD